jgi:hypothetical protein
VTKDERLYLIGDGQAVGRALTRRDLRCISDPQLVPQLAQQALEPAPVPGGPLPLAPDRLAQAKKLALLRLRVPDGA